MVNPIHDSMMRLRSFIRHLPQFIYLFLKLRIAVVGAFHRPRSFLVPTGPSFGEALNVELLDFRMPEDK